MFKHLMIPLDGSRLAEMVVPAAVDLLKRTQARLTLIHIIEREPPAVIHGDRHLRTVAEAESYLMDIRTRCFREFQQVQLHVHSEAVGDLAASLADHAQEFIPDLIIMCSHGEDGWRDWWSGSVAQQVLGLQKLPVLVLRSSSQGAVNYPFKRVFLPLDGHPEHEDALPIAREFVRVVGCPTQLCMVVPTPQTLSGPNAMRRSMFPTSTEAILQDLVVSGTAYLKTTAAPMVAAGVKVTACILRGDPAEAIAGLILRDQVDLTILGTHGKSGFNAFFEGSMGQKLISKTQTSVLLIPVGAGPDHLPTPREEPDGFPCPTV